MENETPSQKSPMLNALVNTAEFMTPVIGQRKVTLEGLVMYDPKAAPDAYSQYSRLIDQTLVTALQFAYAAAATILAYEHLLKG